MLALPPLFAEDGLNGPDVYSGCAPFAQKTVQNAGRAFHERFEARDSESGGSDDGEPFSPGTDDGKKFEKKKKDKSPKKEREDGNLKLPDFLEGDDLYELLESDPSVSQQDLRTAHRRLCLVHHPDKQGTDLTEEEKEAINVKFLKVQEAFDILSDLKKRRKYDSMADFDDAIPTTLKDGQDFYTVFEEAFKRNAKWSEEKPVPELGNSETKYDRVVKFYDFWRNFQSWRDLDLQIMEVEGDDCFQDLNQAECREERRWMERENAKLRTKFQKAERARIQRLTNAGEQNDPRVKAEKDRKLAEVEAKKAEKEAKRRAEEEEKAKKEAERAAQEKAAEEVRLAEKAAKDKEREAKKAKRSKLRKQVKDLNLKFLESKIDDFLISLELDDLESLSSSLKSASDAGEALAQAMRDGGFEPIIIPDVIPEVVKKKAEEPKLSPEEARKLEKEREKKQKERKAKQAIEDAEKAKQEEIDSVKRAEEKVVRDAKKAVENEKKEKERGQADKKEREAQKRAEQKKIKDAAAAEEKAVKDKENSLKRSEEQREKDRIEKEKEDKEKQEEITLLAFEKARKEQADSLEKLEWPAVIEIAKEAASHPSVAGAMAAAQKREGEEKLDALLACLGSFFALGVRPDKDALVLSSTLRNRVKKLRTKVRNAAGAGEFDIALPAGTKADEKALEKVVREAHDPVSVEEKEKEKEKENLPNEASPEKPKKSKAKAKGAPENEDLDDLLKEFGVTATDKKPKAKKKK